MEQCFRCGSPDHFSRDCNAPLTPVIPPHSSSGDSHMARIDAIVIAWRNGQITTGQKRRAIADENYGHYDRHVKRNDEWITKAPSDRYDDTYVQADGFTLA